MISFKLFLESELYTETRDITPIGTISSKEAENKIPKKLNSENIDKYLSQGFINVYRTEGFSMFLNQRNRGIYYFIGDENDHKLELGKCLIAQTKVHAAHLLGFDRKFILKKLNYYFCKDLDRVPLVLFVQRNDHRPPPGRSLRFIASSALSIEFVVLMCLSLFLKRCRWNAST
jgi:hypothetical protein